MKIATIARNPENSPNMTTNDAAILECVTQELISQGNEVVAISGTDEIPDGTEVICHMSRSAEVLNKLESAEERGIAVVNSSAAVRNCSRAAQMHILEESAIPQPFFRIITNEEELSGLPFPAWIKRSNGWSCHKDDVAFSTCREEAVTVFENMRQRGIESVVYTQHCEGDIVKFYGIGEKYFTYSYPNADGTKFGLERINGKAKHYPFDTTAMAKMAAKAAKAVGLEIYGGDCIVDANGKFCLIDLNDFPSFSSVRNEAAKEIARIIMNIKKRYQDERRG
ncbi:MAG: hypothetical protein IKA52_02505 [Bacteroidaceae bacterium]|nr:hypothetical protein [Bacteroidaceae bacterium]